MKKVEFLNFRKDKMSNSKPHRQMNAHTPATRGNTSLAGKLASMAAAATTADQSEDGKSGGSLSMTQLVAELAKQRTSLNKDMAILIHESIKPLQTSVDGLGDTVNSFQGRLTATETLAGENFEWLFKAEATIKSLQAQNTSLSERLENLENRSRRANLRILNIPEGSEDGQDPTTFVSKLLKEAMGADVFTTPPRT